MPHNHQKKIAIINDISGFGRCSTVVQLPVFSVLKIQGCPLPTSILSNHTGFGSFFFKDLTDCMDDYVAEWQKLDLRFSGICSGFLGSKAQIERVEKFFNAFGGKGTVIVVDPVMGDNGRAYATYTSEMCEEMKRLVKHATILTPNLTEACLLTDTPYREDFTRKEIFSLGEKLLEKGPEKVVITGVSRGKYLENYCLEGGEKYVVKAEKVDVVRSGTGDIFTAIVAADAVNGKPFYLSVKRAAAFIKKCIIKAVELDIPKTDGVPFEEVLYTLK